MTRDFSQLITRDGIAADPGGLAPSFELVPRLDGTFGHIRWGAFRVIFDLQGDQVYLFHPLNEPRATPNDLGHLFRYVEITMPEHTILDTRPEGVTDYTFSRAWSHCQSDCTSEGTKGPHRQEGET